MKPITFECPQCHEHIAGDESMYGQEVQCGKCQATMRAPPTPVHAELQTARLLPEPAGTIVTPELEAARPETEVFTRSPVARAFPGRLLLGVMLIALAVGLALRAHDFSWPRWVPVAPLALGLLVLLLLWITVKSSSYRLTTQRLFVRHGWWARQSNELELYRVKDVVVNQRWLQRLLGYGTITVLADDDSTPQVDLAGISRPMAVKEMIRTEYRAARQREGVHPTEFMQSA
jgi:membrane protein YdbS with pleckstrin-like domain